ncbi:MAG: hypothetical protein KatS3mg115_0701 [Candidatus Poribacteria bacterium]|nr:MAG: hypothetical protein KatS3mg115_0701 [Candidatus Poribacteria bacterium]
MKNKTARTAVRWGLWGVACVTVLLSGIAQRRPLTPQEVFANFQQAYAKLHAIQARFEEATVIAGERRTAKGEIIFQKPNLLRQAYLDPNDPLVTAQLIVVDGENSWSYTPWLNQVTRKRLNPKTAQEILPGAGPNFEKLPENYDLSLLSDEAAAKRNMYHLEIRPKPTAQTPVVQEKLEVWIRAEDWIPVQIAYTNEAEEVTTVITLTQVDLNAQPSPETFQFVPPPGVEVITITDSSVAEGEGGQE